MSHDRFGNPFAPELPYAHGEIISDTLDDVRKLRHAWSVIDERRKRLGIESLYQFSGLERELRLEGLDTELLDDELAAALLANDVTRFGLEHLGGDPKIHDVLVVNRLTAALLVAGDVLIGEGEMVVGVSPRYSHPAVARAVAHSRGIFRDTMGLAQFEKAMAEAERVDAVFVTRLPVSYEILPEEDLCQVMRLAKARGAKVIVDDAGGARVGPAVFGQPHMLELGADIVATGLDKYGTVGPRLGLLAGTKRDVDRMRVRAFEMGIEARPFLYSAVVHTLKSYSPERVRELVATTKSVANELQQRVGGNRLFETDLIVQIRGEDVLEMAMERAGIEEPPIVPYEATAGLAMLLLQEHGIITVHLTGLPPGTSALMIKFVPPETLERLGGAATFADAIDDSIGRLSNVLADKNALTELLFGSRTGVAAAAE